jgi:hypothetical protein
MPFSSRFSFEWGLRSGYHNEIAPVDAFRSATPGKALAKINWQQLELVCFPQ